MARKSLWQNFPPNPPNIIERVGVWGHVPVTGVSQLLKNSSAPIWSHGPHTDPTKEDGGGGGTTAAATAFSSGDTLTVARQMAHMPQTAARYYHNVAGQQQAVSAFSIRRKLEQEVNEGSSEDEDEDKEEDDAEVEVGEQETDQKERSSKID